MDTNITPAWAPPAVEPFKQMEEWTRGKTQSFSQFDQLDLQGNSEEGIISGKVLREWGNVLPKMILAKTDAEFDQFWNDYLAKRESLGFAKVHVCNSRYA